MMLSAFLQQRGFWRISVLLYAVLLAGLLLMPQPLIEAVTTESFRGNSRLIHFVLFVPFGGGIALLWGRQVFPLARAIWATLIATLYGVVLEGLQALLPTLQRSFSWRDILANALGAGVGALTLTLLLHVSRHAFSGSDGRRPPHPALMR